MMRDFSLLLGRRPRIAIIALTPRSREYGRRALRLLGCTLLLFLDVNEFLGIGERARDLSMVYLEHLPADAMDDGTSMTMGDVVREVVGDELPIVHSIAVQSGGAVPGFRANDMLLPGSLSFAQLYRTLRGFLQKHGVPVIEGHLEWGAYRFCIDSGLIFIDGKPISVKHEEFDLALELFFNAGAQIPRSWLKSMIPGLQALRRRATSPAADAALLRIRDLLNLQPEHGWDLRVNPGLSCMLVQSEYVN